MKAQRCKKSGCFSINWEKMELDKNKIVKNEKIQHRRRINKI